jgi:hypothetical protein
MIMIMIMIMKRLIPTMSTGPNAATGQAIAMGQPALPRLLSHGRAWPHVFCSFSGAASWFIISPAAGSFIT